MTRASSMHEAAAAAAAKSLQSCPTLCDPIDGSPPGFTIPGILQARTLEWVAISFSNALKWKVKMKSLSHVQLLVPDGLQPIRLLCPWDFPGKSTGVGCHCLLCHERSRTLKSSALGQPRGMMWRGRWEGVQAGRTHMHPWLIHADVWQKPTQYCKSNYPPIKINILT